MGLIKCVTISIILIFTAHAKAIEKGEHSCKILIDDGFNYREEILVCCPGYTVDRTGKCMPICQHPCIYGFCKSPNVCACNEGYEMKKNECIPKCKKKCLYGYCSKPDICGCPNGFELNEKNLTVCEPICRPKCENFSKCTKTVRPSPNRCQCIPGYTENNKTNICEPYCNFNCYNGVCSAPDTCECSNGYELDNINKTNCIPKCEPKCQLYSSCIAHNICKCNDGYKFNEISTKCEPICKDKVKNSRCIKPPNTWICIENYQHDLRIDKCVLEYCFCNSNGYCLENKDKCDCYEGFTKNATTGQCESICQPYCKNSICVANNVCQCLNGNHKTVVNHICEPNDMCNGIPCTNGECLITGECKCKAGYIKSFSYNGQLQCDKVQIAIGKVMTMILGVPILFAAFALITIYVIAKKKCCGVQK